MLPLQARVVPKDRQGFYAPVHSIPAISVAGHRGAAGVLGRVLGCGGGGESENANV